MAMIQQLHQQAIHHINQGEFIKAHPLCVQIVQQQAHFADAWFLLGIINFELGQVKKAIKLMKKALSLDPLDEYRAHLAKALSLTGDLDQARHLAEQSPADKINNPLTLDTLGVALSRVGLHNDALTYFDKAVTLNPTNPGFIYNQAVSLKFEGQFKQARRAFEKAIELNPDYYQAHFALADLGPSSPKGAHIERLQSALSRQHQADARLHIQHALAKEYESTGQFSLAYTALEQGKREKLSQLDYQPEQDRALFELAMKQLSLPAASGFDNDEPIFVLGMPRSGTTLVERILSSHSEVTSAGELQDFGMAVKQLSGTRSRKVLDTQTLEKAAQCHPQELGEAYIQRTRVLSGKTARFVDKLPFNFFYLGLIQRALPKAKIICLLRNPMDTCIGNYRQLFSLNSPYYHYAFDLMHTGQFYEHFWQLAHQAEQQLGDSFKLLDYQTLVSDPQNQIRQLLQFCELPWQEACLHAEQNKAPVSTASKVQVREPINTKSIGRWRRYQPHTQPLEDFFVQRGIPYFDKSEPQ